MSTEVLKVLVIGSSGFIGKWVCETLKHYGCKPIGLDINERLSSQRWLDYYQCDIDNKNILSEIFDKVQPRVVIHLAARVDLDEKASLNDYNTNIDGVRNIIERVKDTSSVDRLIITSSQLVCKLGYMPSSDYDYCPETVYGKSKVLTEQITRELDGGGKTWCIVRPTTVWGPGMSSHYQRLLELIRRGRYFHCGSGKLYKTYGYVENVAYQYYKMLMAKTDQIQGKTYYLGDYEPISLRDYTNGLAQLMGAKPIPTMPIPLALLLAYSGDLLNVFGFKSFPFNRFRLKNIITEYQFDLTETEKICGELPVSFSEGLETTVKWYMLLNRN